MILAVEECDAANVAMCTPSEVSVLFEFPPLFPDSEMWSWLTRTEVLILLAALIPITMVFIALRKPKLVPGRFQLFIESVYNSVDQGIAKDIIGPEGSRYTPYLISLFAFIFFGNIFEVTPFVNFPVTSRIALPAFLALLTWFIFIIAGISKQGLTYFGHLIWPPGIPIALRPLVGVIEFVSVLFVRPFSLAVRLFANLVAGHTMLALLLSTSGIFIWGFIQGDLGFGKALTGGAWFLLGLGIYVFEILVSYLQAYIFTLLSAVYIESSLHPEH